MCLQRIVTVLSTPEKKVVKAYKYFEHILAGVMWFFPYYPVYPTRWSPATYTVEFDIWHMARHKTVVTSSRTESYLSGFHAYTQRVHLVECFSDTSERRTVYLYGIRVHGVENGRPCLVADWLYIPSDQKAPPPPPPTRS